MKRVIFAISVIAALAGCSKYEETGITIEENPLAELQNIYDFSGIATEAFVDVFLDTTASDKYDVIITDSKYFHDDIHPTLYDYGGIMWFGLFDKGSKRRIQEYTDTLTSYTAYGETKSTDRAVKYIVSENYMTLLLSYYDEGRLSSINPPIRQDMVTMGGTGIKRTNLRTSLDGTVSDTTPWIADYDKWVNDITVFLISFYELASNPSAYLYDIDSESWILLSNKYAESICYYPKVFQESDITRFDICYPRSNYFYLDEYNENHFTSGTEHKIFDDFTESTGTPDRIEWAMQESSYFRASWMATKTSYTGKKDIKSVTLHIEDGQSIVEVSEL